MNSVNDVMPFTSSNYHSPSPEYFDRDGDERRGRQLSPQPWRFQDPRGSSTHSLLPTDELAYVPSATPTRDARCSRDNRSSASVVTSIPTPNRRTLLIIYIHGFLGDTTSFKSFPAHVHGYLTKKLRETHVVHTKLYPRYKSYRPLPTAREEFSKWLAPHLENDGTGEKDVVLVGHSMGGMLAAEVVLLPPLKPNSARPLRHRILGHISCDSPFLSLHPNLVVSGLKSLMPGRQRFDEETENPDAPSLFDSPDPSSWPSETPSPLPSPYPNLNKPKMHSPILSLHYEESPSHIPPNSSPIPSASSAVSTDPTFNPPFWNDITYPYRGIWRTVAHFSKKYDYRPGAIASATLQQMCENASYAGCLLDVPNLMKRYKHIRELENQNNRHRVRVRWANFYTVCSGERIAAVAPDLKKRNESPHGPQDAKLLSKTEAKREIRNRAVSGTCGELEEEIGVRQIYIGTHRAGRVENDIETVSLGDRGEGEQSDTTPRISISDWSLSREEINGAAGLSDWYESEVEESRSNNSSLVGENIGIVNAGAPTLTRPASAPPTASTKSFDIIGQGPGSVGSSAEHKPTGRSTPRTQLRSEQNLRKSHNAVSPDQQFEYDTDTKIRLELAKSELETMTRGRQYRGNQNLGEIQRLKGLIRDLETQLPYSTSHPPSVTSSRIGSPEKGNHTGPESPSFKSLAKPGGKKEAKKHTRKFCLLPTGAEMDHTWIKVDMGDVDEVGAHCGLFNSESAHYRDFLGIFCEKVVGWVEEDVAARAATLKV